MTGPAMDLFAPFRVGPYNLRNRFVMAPMARARCDENRAPTPMVGAGAASASPSTTGPRDA